MWLEAIYEPTTLFSLKPSDATNRGAKSLLAPSPYAIKMALLNAMITFGGFDFEKEELESEQQQPKGKGKNKQEVSKTIFSIIRDLDIRFALPQEAIASNCFVKIQKQKRIEGEAKETETELMDTTVTFREYIYFNGDFRIAFKVDDESRLLLEKYLPKINYFGKRGCFFQFIEFKKLDVELAKELPSNYCKELTEGFSVAMISGSILSKMDDFESNAAFSNANVYSAEKAKRKEKVFLIPTSRQKSSKNFTLYTRT